MKSKLVLLCAPRPHTFHALPLAPLSPLCRSITTSTAHRPLTLLTISTSHPLTPMPCSCRSGLLWTSWHSSPDSSAPKVVRHLVSSKTGGRCSCNRREALGVSKASLRVGQACKGCQGCLLAACLHVGIVHLLHITQRNGSVCQSNVRACRCCSICRRHRLSIAGSSRRWCISNAASLQAGCCAGGVSKGSPGCPACGRR